MELKQDFRKMANNQLRLKLFFLKKMPMGFLSGMRVIEISQKEAIVSVPFNYLTKNPLLKEKLG